MKFCMKNENKNKYRKRVRILKVIAFLISGILLSRLFQIQILHHEQWSKIATKQHQSKIKLELPRGNIFDRRGAVLALDIPKSYSFGVQPGSIKSRVALARSLSHATGKNAGFYLEKFRSDASFIWVERQLDTERASSLMNIKELVQKQESRRFYPYNEVTPKAVGFTDRDCKGIAGIETEYDDALASIPGWETVLADAFGKQIENPVYSRVDPIPGADLILTIDNVIQDLVNRELSAAVRQHKAKGGMVIVMLPRTGEILAMTSYPFVNPNYPGDYDNLDRREKCVTDVFEPGSTFKIVPALAAIKKGMSLDRMIDCGNGVYQVGTHKIKDTKPHSNLTFKDVVVKSSNVGTARIARWVGSEELYKTARDFGFGTCYGIDMPGEGRGILSIPSKWDKYQLATIGIGQGVSVTAIQMAGAYCAIANDGVLVKPRLVKAISRSGNAIENTKPVAVRKIAKKKAVEKLIEILIEVVERGTGKPAKIENVKIAGKTGTAQKPLQNAKGYGDEYLASFIGFTVEEPRLLCLVMIDEPEGHHYGAEVAAPVFKNIMGKVIPIVNSEQNQYIGPAYNIDNGVKTICATPNLINIDLNLIEGYLDNNRIKFDILGDGKKVVTQYPFPGQILAEGDTLFLYTDPLLSCGNYRGMNVREATKKLIASGFNVKILGSGLVESVTFNGRSCIMTCRNI